VTVDTPAWVRDAVFYQVFPDRFGASDRVPKPGSLEPWDAPPTIHGFKGGDLLGIAERLPELVDLGVTALYLTPVFTSASNHRYHAYDYHSVDPLLGGDSALRELLDAAHGHGLRLILDGVFNHCGRGFWQFHHILEQGAASPYRDWFLLDEAVREGRANLNAYPDRSGASRRVGHPLGYRAWWGLPALPKFNVAHPPVRAYLLDVAERWLRFGIDGWRLDVPAEIEDETFWQEFRDRCRAVNPEAYLVGEIWDEAPEWLAGDRFDALMNYPLGAAILGFVGGQRLNREVIARHDTYARTVKPLDAAAFGSRLGQLMSIYDPAVVASQLNLIGSHDAPRALTVLAADRTMLRQAMLLQLTVPGAPCIYYGDEVGLEGGVDPDCRRAYPVEPDAGDRQLRSFVRALIGARNEHVALRRGDVALAAVGQRAIVLEREADGFRAFVALNAGEADERLELRHRDHDRLRVVEVPGLVPVALEPGAHETAWEGARTVILPPGSGSILLVE
jgi:neopullulanase